mgnify:CR=1 FL=1
MALTKSTIGFLAIGLIISVLIVSISSVAIYQSNNTPSSEYNTGVQVFGGICLGTSLIALITSPIIAGLRGKKLGFFILAVLLSGFVVAVSSMAIKEATESTSDTYKDIVRGVAGAGLASALIGIIAVFVIAFKMRN